MRGIKPSKNSGNRQLIRMLERRIGRDMVGPMLARKHNNYHQSDAKHFKFFSSEFLAVDISVHIYQNKLELVWKIYRSRGSTWCIIKLREWSVSTWFMINVNCRKQWQKTLGIMFWTVLFCLSGCLASLFDSLWHNYTASLNYTNTLQI